MAKARLTTGEIIELKKDCGCLDSIHTGPHFLHEDDIRKTTNDFHQPDLERLVKNSHTFIETLNVNVFASWMAESEIRRINAMLKWMNENNITELIEE